MSDFFLHITPSKESRAADQALTYFKRFFPEADNSIHFFEEFILTISADPSRKTQTLPVWYDARKAWLFVSGEYIIPDSVEQAGQITDNDSDRLPGLFELYGESIIEALSGNFNAFLYYPNENRFISITSKLGLYPLYYCQKGQEFLVCSRLGVFKQLQGPERFNPAVVMQSCLYNYPVSSATFIQGVFVQPAGSVLSFYKGKVTIKHYWSISREMTGSADARMNFNDSVDLLDEVLDRLIQRYCSRCDKIGLSLTGGWDGRLLLSYVLKYLTPDKVLLYSHGTSDSPDVAIPLATAKKLDLNYEPILLDDPGYLNRQMEWAADTVAYSDGMRQISRVHYLYNMSRLRNVHGIDNIISGNGGSNLIKSTNYKPCQVFNRFVIELIESEDLEKTLQKHYEYSVREFPSLFQHVDWSSFIDSFDLTRFQSLLSEKNVPLRFFHFLVSEIERKYFGSELQSYKHLVKNYSPFFDDEFLAALMKTAFLEPDGNKGLLKSHRMSVLYARLIERNNGKLAKEPTDRGFSMHDIAHPIFFPRMLYRYYKKKKNSFKKPDYFNNNQMIEDFSRQFLEKSGLLNVNNSHNKPFLENYISVMSFLQMPPECNSHNNY
jgi:asparagine synthetase B (glutamine-hydrolysing)